MKRPNWTYGFFYRLWSRLLHSFNLHHTHRIGPLEDGVMVDRCEWCGVSRRVKVYEHGLEHLRDDASFRVCDECGRKSYDLTQNRCWMIQPDGSQCPGILVLSIFNRQE